MISLDIRTLSFIAMLCSLLVALGLQLVNRIIARDASLRLWAIGAGANCAGFVLLALRGMVPDLVSIVLANFCLQVGAAYLYLGNRSYQGGQEEPPWYWFVVAGSTTALAYFAYIVPSLTARIVVSSATTAIILFPAAFVLLHHGDRRDRLVRWFVGLTYLATALVIAMRAVVAPFVTSAGEDLMAVVSIVHMLPFILGIALSVVLGIGLPLMVSGRMQRQLMESEVQLKGILESTADGMLAASIDGKVLLTNQRFGDMWQIPQALLDGGDDEAMLKHVVAQLRDPEAFLTKVHALYKSNAEASDILHFKDGRVFERHSSPLILNGSILGRVWSFHDVTERTHAQEQLRASEERFRDLTTLSSDWFWEQDAQFRFTIMSDERCGASSLSPANTLGKTRWELPIVGVDEEQWKTHRAALERHEAFEHFVYQLRNDNGELLWFSISGKPVFDADGVFRGYRGTGHDITERVNLERKLRRTQKMEAVGRLAGGIAHAFNNFLAAIVGNERLARADLAPDDPARESLNEIAKGARRAQDLVRQLLTFSQPQDTQRKPLDARAAVEDALHLLHATLPAMIEVRADFEPGLPAMLANPWAISQIVMRLGTNAAEAMRHEGIVEISVKAVEAERLPANLTPAIPSGPCICIALRDTGTGMDRTTRERVFDPFFTTKGSDQGAGLGLSVVLGILRDLEGAIRVASTPGLGTTFYVYIPASLQAPQAAGAASTPEPAATHIARSLRILFVDDEEALVFLSRRLLQRMGYQVRGYEDPVAALKAFKCAPQDFDVVITDLAMPHMNGLDLAERILAIRPGMTILVMSGNIRDEDTRRAHALGIHDLYWKPNTVEDLAQVLHTRIAESHRA